MKLLGILGGMGPEATVTMFSKIVRQTVAATDQEHIEVIVHSNNNIPDRTRAILQGGASPLPELYRSLALLNRCGVAVIVIPCMTSHYYYPQLQKQSECPIINAIDLAATACAGNDEQGVRVGILATTGTIQTGLFQKAMASRGIECLIPDREEQESLVMEAIYGKGGIKSGEYSGEVRHRLLQCVDSLLAQGAEAIMAGCTEIPLVLSQQDLAVPFIDPMEIMARQAILDCGGTVRTGKMRPAVSRTGRSDTAL
jgi:aspartate racemase